MANANNDIAAEILTEMTDKSFIEEQTTQRPFGRSKDPNLKKLGNSSFWRHTVILFQSFFRKTITART